MELVRDTFKVLQKYCKVKEDNFCVTSQMSCDIINCPFLLNFALEVKSFDLVCYIVDSLEEFFEASGFTGIRAELDKKSFSELLELYLTYFDDEDMEVDYE